MLKEVNSSLFDLKVDALAHGCNTQGIMNAGIAKDFREKYPQMFEEYQSYCKSGLFQTGDIHVYQDNKTGIYIINIASQFDLETGARIEYIRKGLNKVEKQYSSLGIQSLALPRIGCNLGKLNWREVKPVIEEVFSGSKLEVIVAFLN